VILVSITFVYHSDGWARPFSCHSLDERCRCSWQSDTLW